jgi:hypothetical protein
MTPMTVYVMASVLPCEEIAVTVKRFPTGEPRPWPGPRFR